MPSVVADTHAALWHLMDDARLGTSEGMAMDSAVASGVAVYVPSICLVELTYLIEKKRLPESALRALVRTLGSPSSGYVIAPLDEAVALAVGQIPRDQVPDLPDRVIAATALSLGLPLVTRDGRIRASHIQTIWQQSVPDLRFH